MENTLTSHPIKTKYCDERRLIDLNNDPLYEICDLESDEVVGLNDTANGTTNDNLFEPFLGQCFPNEEDAYIFYENFARKNGFSIRRGRFANKNGTIVRRDFFCHREGFPEKKIVESSKEQRNRLSSRCGCKASMRITLKKPNEIFPEEWHVTLFTVQHNHPLLSPAQVRFLPSYRTITEEDKKQLLLYKEAGLCVKQIMRVMELKKNVKFGDLPFLHKDVHNFFSGIQRKKLDNDAMALLEYCKSAKIENPSFQFDYTVDRENKLESIFWSPPRCFDLYQEFGDCSGLDTTYRVNSYDMPFAIFIGIDNHGRTILFGCALLRNETAATFRWLMKTFVTLMKKPPITIITDQDPWMTQAISIEMPSTRHAFCIWHITSKFSGWFSALLKNQYSDWVCEFYKLYRLDDIDDFEREWSLVISKFNLQENKHVRGLYEIRKSWVPAYLRDYFFGGMTTTGRCESINSFVKRFTSSRSCLTQLIKQIDLAVVDIGQTQLHHMMLDIYRGSSLRTLSPLEEQVYKVFTAFAFKKFQEEFERATQYTICEKVSMVFVVQHYKELRSQEHIVKWNGDEITCSCKLFEFWGIICRHVLSVFIHKDCFEIPRKYLPLRWYRDEFHVGVGISALDQRMMAEMASENINDFDEQDFICSPPVSKTKGRPKFRREVGGKEAAKKHVRSCTFCKKTGHNITTCPEKENINENIISTNIPKKRKKNGQSEEALNPVFCVKE